jgi:hypothetical protein
MLPIQILDEDKEYPIMQWVHMFELVQFEQ